MVSGAFLAGAGLFSKTNGTLFSSNQIGLLAPGGGGMRLDLPEISRSDSATAKAARSPPGTSAGAIAAGKVRRRSRRVQGRAFPEVIAERILQGRKLRPVQSGNAEKMEPTRLLSAKAERAYID